MYVCFFFFFKQKTAYEMRISDWSSDVCSSDLAARYAGLVEDRALADSIFNAISDGWQRTHDSLLDATGQRRLLEHSPSLDASIRLRLPYIEPLNLLQVDLIRRHRGGDADAKVVEGIQLTIKDRKSTRLNSSH